MKEILYLDTGFLNSFLSQAHDGLPISKASEIQKTTAEANLEGTTKGETHEATLGVRSLIQALIKTGENSSLTDTFTLTQTEAVKELISRQFHDNSLDLLISTLQDNNQLLKFENQELNKNQYILNNASFKFFDMEYLKSFGDKNFIAMLTKHTSAGQKSSNNKKNNDPYRIGEMMKMLDAASVFLPSDMLIKQQGFIFPLKKEFLRESSNQINFKLDDGDKITVLGKVKRRIVSTNTNLTPNSDNLLMNLASLFKMSEDFLIALGLTEKNDYVVTPIAIYFENV